MAGFYEKVARLLALEGTTEPGRSDPLGRHARACKLMHASKWLYTYSYPKERYAGSTFFTHDVQLVDTHSCEVLLAVL